MSLHKNIGSTVALLGFLLASDGYLNPLNANQVNTQPFIVSQNKDCRLPLELQSASSNIQLPSDPNWEIPKSILHSKYGSKQNGHSDVVSSVAFSPDGNFLVSGSLDKTVKVWNLNSKKLERTFPKSRSKISSVAFSPNGKFLADSNLLGEVRLWDWNKRSLFDKSINSIVGSFVTFSPNSEMLALASGSEVKVWRIKNNKLQLALKIKEKQYVLSVAFSPSNNLLASAGIGKTIELWNAKTGEWLCTLGRHESRINSIAFSSDGKVLASSTTSFIEDGKIRLWSMQSLELLRKLDGHTKGVRAIALSPSGRLLVSGSFDETVRIWKVEDGSQLRNPFTVNIDQITSISFRSDGKAFATGSSDGTVQVFTYAGL